MASYCQKCRLPLRLESSLQNLNPAAYDLLVASSSHNTPSKAINIQPAPPQDKPIEKQRMSFYNNIAQEAPGPAFKRTSGGSYYPARDPSMSFIYLTQSQVGTSWSPPAPQRHAIADRGAGIHPDVDADNKEDAYQIERMNKLFEILSARSDIDHPVCVECTDILIDEFQKRLEVVTKERDAYISYLKELQAEEPSDDDVKLQQDALKRAEVDESQAMEELLRLERDKELVDEEIRTLEEEIVALDVEEEHFWRDRNEFALKLSEFQNQRDSVNSRFDHDSQLLERLQRSNVYNDTFCISHDGTFATINGLRLGRLSSKPVDWPEINAAWGHALLLLVTVAEKLDFKFSGFEPQPLGSSSKIIRIEYPAPSSSRFRTDRESRAPPPPPKRNGLELYSSGDTPLGLTFMHRKLNAAMVAFLELVRQLGTFVEKETESGVRPALKLPYRIDGERIGDVSIKLGIAQDESWTKACKLTLTCCKFLLAHASNVSTRARHE